MSRLPDEQGVKTLLDLAKKSSQLQSELIELNERLKRDSARRTIVSDELSQARNSMIDQLEQMDCRANGNAGWQHRITWMIEEIERQTSCRNASAAAEKIHGQSTTPAAST